MLAHIQFPHSAVHRPVALPKRSALAGTSRPVHVVVKSQSQDAPGFGKPRGRRSQSRASSYVPPTPVAAPAPPAPRPPTPQPTRPPTPQPPRPITPQPLRIGTPQPTVRLSTAQQRPPRARSPTRAQVLTAEPLDVNELSDMKKRALVRLMEAVVKECNALKAQRDELKTQRDAALAKVKQLNAEVKERDKNLRQKDRDLRKANSAVEAANRKLARATGARASAAAPAS